MAWYDEPAKYYGKHLSEEDPLSQGDIVLAPTAVISTNQGDANVVAPAALGESRTVRLWVAGSDELPSSPEFSAEVRWGLAMVIPHSCAMEKEWNQRVDELRQETGYDQAKAEAEATADTSLDPFVSLAAILTYDGRSDADIVRIRAGSALGFFPVCQHLTIPFSYVDLSQLSTARYEVLPTSRRVAGLSDLAAAHLQHALAMTFAFRSLDRLDKLRSAIGHSIMDLAVTTRTKNKLVVSFILDDGSTLTLEGNPSMSNATTSVRPARK